MVTVHVLLPATVISEFHLCTLFSPKEPTQYLRADEAASGWSVLASLPGQMNLVVRFRFISTPRVRISPTDPLRVPIHQTASTSQPLAVTF